MNDILHPIFVGPLFAGFGLGSFVVSHLLRIHFEKQIVDHGAGHYDEKTGDFRWNEEVGR